MSELRHSDGSVVRLALVAAVIGLFACIYIRRFIVRRQFAHTHGCRPVAGTVNKDPFLGLDTIPGTIRALKQHKVLERGCELFSVYGNTFKLKELHVSAILTVEPENIKTILSLKFSDYGIGHRLQAFKPLLGQGIFDTDGDHWASSRALVRPSFARHQVADLASFERLTQDLFSVLPRDGKTIVDLQPLFFCYTIDSATEFLFGQSAATLKTGQSQHAFALAFHRAQKAIIVRGTLGPLNWFYRDRVADESNRICRDFARQFVEDAFRTVASGIEKREKAGTEPQKYVFAHELASRTTDKDRVLDELMNLLIAGRDTTASLLSNLFFVLAKNPTIWQKLRKEVATLDGCPPTYEQLRGLEYVQCCLNECESVICPKLHRNILSNLIALKRCAYTQLCHVITVRQCEIPSCHLGEVTMVCRPFLSPRAP
jgi:cytochrome P450